MSNTTERTIQRAYARWVKQFHPAWSRTPDEGKVSLTFAMAYQMGMKRGRKEGIKETKREYNITD